MLRAAFALLLSLAGAAASAAQPPVPSPAPWTGAEARAMDPAVMTRRLFGDFGQALMPYPPLNASVSAYQRLAALYFVMVPRGSQDPGLCDSEMVTVSFAPVDPANAPINRDVPVQPRSIGLLPQFIIYDLDRARGTRRSSGAERAAQQRTCAAIDPRTAHRIGARSSGHVIRAIAHFDSLVRRARSGELEPMLDCRPLARSGWPVMSAAECARVLAGFRTERIVMSYDCGLTPRCLHIEAEDQYLIYIHFDRDIAFGGDEVPVRIEVTRMPPMRMH